MKDPKYFDTFDELMDEVDKLVDKKFPGANKDRILHLCVVRDLARKMKTRCDNEKYDC